MPPPARTPARSLTGNCRLGWYDHLLRNPLRAPAEAEEFTRLLHKSIVDDPSGLGPVLATAAEKLDLGNRKPRPSIRVHSPQEALEAVKQALVDAQAAYAAALAPLSKSEIQEIDDEPLSGVGGQEPGGPHAQRPRHRPPPLRPDGEDGPRRHDRRRRGPGRDHRSEVARDQLKQLPRDGNVSVAGVMGHVAAKIDTPAGAIVIGGKGDNTYHLDDMPGVAAVIDLGGNNIYYEGTISPERPVLLVLDLGGNNVYQAQQAGRAGRRRSSACRCWLNLEGDNRLRGPGRCPRLQPGGRRHPRSTTAATTATAASAACKARRWAASASSSTAAAATTITPPCGPRASAARWASALLENLGGDDHYYCGGTVPQLLQAGNARL